MLKLFRTVERMGEANRARLFDHRDESFTRRQLRRLRRKVADWMHWAGMSTVQATISTEFKWSVGNSLTGSAYNQVQNVGDIRKNYAFGTAAGNAASGGGDEVFSFQQTIAGGGSATINLQAMTNLLQQASVSIARVKGYQIRLLSTTDDSTITAPAASSITVTNIGPGTPSALDFNNGGINGSVTITNTFATGAIASLAVSNAGSGYPPNSYFMAVPQTTLGSNAAFLCNTNATGVISGVSTFQAGTLYANGAAPLVPAGQYTVNGGGAHMYFDVLAAGFLAVAATSINIKIYNNDPANTATVEISVLAATT